MAETLLVKQAPKLRFNSIGVTENYFVGIKLTVLFEKLTVLADKHLESDIFCWLG